MTNATAPFSLSSTMDLHYLFAYGHYSICGFCFQYANYNSP